MFASVRLCSCSFISVRLLVFANRPARQPELINEHKRTQTNEHEHKRTGRVREHALVNGEPARINKRTQTNTNTNEHKQTNTNEHEHKRTRRVRRPELMNEHKRTQTNEHEHKRTGCVREHAFATGEPVRINKRTQTNTNEHGVLANRPASQKR